MQWKIWGAIILAAIGWGTTGVATRAALIDGVPPIAMAAIRAVLAATVLLAVLMIRRHRFDRDPRRWRTGLIAGIFQLSLPFIFFTLAYQYASAGFVGLLTALIPIGTAILANSLLPDEPMTVAKAVGLSVAFAGVALLLLSGDSGLSEGNRPLLAGGLTLAAVSSVSLATVLIRGRPGTYEPIELTFMQFLVGVFVVGGTMLIVEGMPSGISVWGWTMILYLTAFGSLLPTLLFYWVLQQTSSTRAAMVGYVVPLIALVAGIVLLDEKLQFGLAIGGALILVGIVLTDRAETQGSGSG
jgi:drug/metabolite transporter (DMT)-like permease